MWRIAPKVGVYQSTDYDALKRKVEQNPTTSTVKTLKE